MHGHASEESVTLRTHSAIFARLYLYVTKQETDHGSNR